MSGGRARIRAAALAGGLAAALAVPAPAAAQWRVSVGTGTGWNLPLPLTIEQDGAPTLSLTAHWSTHPFDTPLYYVARVERARGGGAWAVELVHHKLFLDDPPAEVQHLEISHGFNVVTAQRAWELRRGVSVRTGAGVVVAHPETIVRGRRQPRGGWGGRGYYVAGPTAQVGAGWTKDVAPKTRVGVEARLIGAHASVPIASGRARLWNAGAHLSATLSRAL